MGGGQRLPGELAWDCSDILFPPSDDVSSTSSDESETVELPPISPASSKPCEACVSAYARARAVLDAKDFILRYKPGDLIEDADGIRAEDYQIPDATTLLLVGSNGSGKTTLLKRIIKLFDSNPFLQENHVNNSSELDGTDFLQEYMVPKRGSKSICIYDTPVLSNYSENNSDNFKMLEQWINNGVRNADTDIWESDNVYTKMNIDKKSQQRMINYVIFVVDAISILKSMENADKEYFNHIAETFNYPFLSFKDNKPAVVITNGEKLSSAEISYVHDYIKELLHIPSAQIFKIPGLDDYDTELSILRLLLYCVNKADKSLQLKPKSFILGNILQWSVRMMDRLVIYDKTIDGIIVFLCIFILLLRVLGLFGK